MVDANIAGVFVDGQCDTINMAYIRIRHGLQAKNHRSTKTQIRPFGHQAPHRLLVSPRRSAPQGRVAREVRPVLRGGEGMTTHITHRILLMVNVTIYGIHGSYGICLYLNYFTYLVGGWATPLKNMKVNWDD